MNIDNYNIVPLSNSPNQSMDITIPVDGKNLKITLRVSYNAQGAYWCMTIIQYEVVLVDSIPLIYTAYPASDLLSQYKYLNLGSAFIIKASPSAQDMADSTNLGSDFLLVWGDTIV